jgi:hypothetical protein
MTAPNAKEATDPVRLMLAYLCIAVDKEASLESKVAILIRFDLSNDEIAKVCGSKAQSVRNARTTLNKHRTPKKSNK